MGSVLQFVNEDHFAAKEKGFVYLHRKMLDQPFARCPVKSSVWIYLLLNAQYKAYEADMRGQRVILRPGQLITGRKQILAACFDQKLFEVTEDMVRGAINYFKKEGMLTVESSRKGSIYTIVNWATYQGDLGKKAPQAIPQAIPQAKTPTTPQANPSNDGAYSDSIPKQKKSHSPSDSPRHSPLNNNKYLSLTNVRDCQNSDELTDLLGSKPEKQTKPKTPPCPYGQIQEIYNECLPTMTGSRILSNKTKNQIQRIWRQDKSHQSLDFWRDYFTDLNQLKEQVAFWSGAGAANGKKRGIDLITREDIFIRSINELIEAGVWS